MKNLRQNLDDSLRPEYKRSDFGEMVQGRFAYTQLQFAELVSLLIACIGEDEGVTFIHHSPGNDRAGHKSGEWSYELDNANQITLRYWINEFKNIAEPISNPTMYNHTAGKIRPPRSAPEACSNPQERSGATITTGS